MDAAALAPLHEPEALELIRVLQEVRATVVSAALAREPHRMTAYLTEVATAFHAFYHRHQIVAPGDRETTVARLALCRGTQLVIREALALLGVSAPERM
jgi:arginyl-tRNA synthetase